MSRFEQLRGELAKINQQVVEREIARLAAEKEAERQKALQLAQERAKERQIEENWQAVKAKILGLYRDINEQVLDSEGNVVPWQKRRQSHLHESEHEGSDTDGYYHYFVYERCDTTAEIAELRIREKGKLAAVRISQRYISSNSGGHSKREVLNWPKEQMRLNCPELDNPTSYRGYKSEEKGKWGNWVFLGYSTEENEVICTDNGYPFPLQGKLPADVDEKLREILSENLKSLFSSR